VKLAQEIKHTWRLETVKRQMKYQQQEKGSLLVYHLPKSEWKNMPPATKQNKTVILLNACKSQG
jgi:hypothetical protein